MKKLYFSLIFFLIIAGVPSRAFTTAIFHPLNTLTYTVTASDLATGAGSDFLSAITLGTITGNVENVTTSTTPWTVTLRYDNSGYPSMTPSGSVVASVTSTGTGVSGGTVTSTSTITVSTTNQTLFTGKGNVNNIVITFSLNGLTLSNATAKNYGPPLVFTGIESSYRRKTPKNELY